MEYASGDRIIVTAGGARLAWTIHAVNSRVVKYIDEQGRYGQMPVSHLEELLVNGQAELERGGGAE